MKHIYISSIAILAITFQISFAQSTFDTRQTRILNLDKGAQQEYWQLINKLEGTSIQNETRTMPARLIKIENTAFGENKPFNLEVINELDVKINEINSQVETEVIGMQKRRSQIEAIEKSEAARQQQNLEPNKIAQDKLNQLKTQQETAFQKTLRAIEIEKLQLQRDALIEKWVNDVNKTSKYFNTNPLRTPLEPLPPKAAPIVKPGIFSKIGNLLTPKLPPAITKLNAGGTISGTAGNAAMIAIPIVTKDVIQPFLTPAQKYIDNLEKKKKDIQIRMAVITTETKNNNFSHIQEKNILQNKLDSTEKMIDNYYENARQANNPTY